MNNFSEHIKTRRSVRTYNGQTLDNAGSFADPLEMVRFALYAVNKQPWRVVVIENAVHFYLRRNRDYRHGGNLDLQMIDMSIALCHFALTAAEYGLNVEFVRNTPQLASNSGAEYVASSIRK